MRLKGRRILTLCSLIVIVWIIYVIVVSVKPKTWFGGRKNIHEVIKYIPSHIRSMVKEDRSKTPVVVVEEHHEVIPYWFAAAESDIISKGGVTILHVDGHSDTGTPLIIDDYPLFTWPRSLSQLFTLMQKNDVFVMGAALTGLVKRFIWVWPMWDKVNHDSEHESVFVIGGSTVRTLDSGKVVTVLCGCVNTAIDQKECYMTNYTHIESEDYVPIQEHECDFNKNVSGIYEEVSEEYAIKLMATGKWINPTEELIVDIDEDFYGCESVGSKLNKAGIQGFLIEQLGSIVENMFCSDSVSGEIIADNFFNSLIQMISKLKVDMINCRRSKPSESLKNKCLSYIGIQQQMLQKIPELVENLNSYDESVLCSGNREMNYLLLQGIMRNLIKLTVKQLRVLAKIGLCLPISPKTLGYEPNMRVCTSYNQPNSTLVFFYSPSLKDIKHRSDRLLRLFSQKYLSPKFITITRSVRDGYTPREHSYKIESDLMKILQTSFVGVEKELIHFDISLLGGLEGWSGRH